jgi:SAM-dependent methyltransferase
LEPASIPTTNDASQDAKRFAFGKNWHAFVKTSFSEERLAVAQQHILDFSNRSSLEGLDFLDIGCGSGLHSYGALRAGARRVLGFDYDPDSVAASRILHKHAGSPAAWTIRRGDILDESYVAGLGKWGFVYSWGVLHHTGNVWKAIGNAQSLVDQDGYFYVSLYSADVQSDTQFWLDVKRKYNASTRLNRFRMVLWYCWEFGMRKEIRNFPKLVNQILNHRFRRGMNYFSDVRDWLGGWPMEFVHDQDVVDLLEGEYGFRLVNVATGHACTEFLFQKAGSPLVRSVVKDIVAVKRQIPTPQANGH